MLMYRMLELLVLDCVVGFTPLAVDIEKPVLDRNSYQVGRLPNGMTVALVHNICFKQSVLCLNVRVGATDDPPGLPGLGYLVKSMMNGRTARRPDWHEVARTASTCPSAGYRSVLGSESTRYTVWADTNEIDRVIESLAESIVDPLFDPERIRQKLYNMRIEHAVRRHSPYYRNAMMLHALLREGECRSRLGLGHLMIPAECGLGGLITAARNFLQHHYTGHRMALVFCSDMSLEQMAQRVGRFAAGILPGTKAVDRSDALARRRANALNGNVGGREGDSAVVQTETREKIRSMFGCIRWRNSNRGNRNGNRIQNSRSIGTVIRNRNCNGNDIRNRNDIRNSNRNINNVNITNVSNIKSVSTSDLSLTVLRFLSGIKDGDCFLHRNEAYQKIYRTKAENPVSLLTVTVSLPASQEMAKAPLSFLADLIYRKSRYTLVPRLVRLQLGHDMHRCGTVEHRDYSQLMMTITLSELGTGKVDGVVDQLLIFLRSLSVSCADVAEWIADRQRAFERLTSADPDTLATRIATNMLDGPLSSILARGCVYATDEIDVPLCRQVLAYIADYENWLLVLADKNYKWETQANAKYDAYMAMHYNEERWYWPSPNVHVYIEDPSAGQSSGSGTKAAVVGSAVTVQSNGAANGSSDCQHAWLLPRTSGANSIASSHVCKQFVVEVDESLVCLCALLLEMARLSVLLADCSGQAGGCNTPVVEVAVSACVSSGPPHFLVSFATRNSQAELFIAFNNFVAFLIRPSLAHLELAKVGILDRYGSLCLQDKIIKRLHCCISGRLLPAVQASWIASLSHRSLEALLSLVQLSAFPSFHSDNLAPITFRCPGLSPSNIAGLCNININIANSAAPVMVASPPLSHSVGGVLAIFRISNLGLHLGGFSCLHTREAKLISRLVDIAFCKLIIQLAQPHLASIHQSLSPEGSVPSIASVNPPRSNISIISLAVLSSLPSAAVMGAILCFTSSIESILLDTDPLVYSAVRSTILSRRVLAPFITALPVDRDDLLFHNTIIEEAILRMSCRMSQQRVAAICKSLFVKPSFAVIEQEFA